VSWIVFGLSYALGTSVLLSHRSDKVTRKGDMVLCAVQAGLIYAAPLLVANTTLGLIIQVSTSDYHPTFVCILIWFFS
jgi:hypothetical protein